MNPELVVFADVEFQVIVCAPCDIALYQPSVSLRRNEAACLSLTGSHPPVSVVTAVLQVLI